MFQRHLGMQRTKKEELLTLNLIPHWPQASLGWDRMGIGLILHLVKRSIFPDTSEQPSVSSSVGILAVWTAGLWRQAALALMLMTQRNPDQIHSTDTKGLQGSHITQAPDFNLWLPAQVCSFTACQEIALLLVLVVLTRQLGMRVKGWIVVFFSGVAIFRSY